MKKLLITLFLFTTALYSIQAKALVCYNAKGAGVVDEIYYDLSSSFTAANNQPGSIVQLSRNFNTPVNAVCPRHVNNLQTKRSYVTDLPILEVVGNYKFLKLNDYLSGAMRINDSYAKDFYPPRNYVQMGQDTSVPQGRPFSVHDRDFLFRLKVLRPFINHVVIPKQTMFRVYVTTTTADPLSTPVYTISYSGIINVPQSCEINAGQIINIPFGRVSAHLFNQAGAKPETVNPVQRQIAIQCKNINAQALLTLRLEAERAVDDIMVSNNPNIGFQASDIDGKILRPNDIKSSIKFQLDNAASARIPLKFWPVSVTGVRPTAGLYTGRGYLRVDYD